MAKTYRRGRPGQPARIQDNEVRVGTLYVPVSDGRSIGSSRTTAAPKYAKRARTKAARQISKTLTRLHRGI